MCSLMCLLVWAGNGIISGKHVSILSTFETHTQKDAFRLSAKEKLYLILSTILQVTKSIQVGGNTYYSTLWLMHKCE